MNETIDEIVERIYAAYENNMDGGTDLTFLKQIIAQEIAAEREACALLALDLHKVYSAKRAESDQHAIARMIRARGEQ